jgi:glutamate dehydrogenase
MDSARVDDLLAEVGRFADDHGIDDGDREALGAFARSFASRVPPVIEHDEETIPARIVSMFEFISTREQPSKVRVFTPTVESHGYEVGGSIVEVATPDSPFLLDSITNEIERHDVKVAGVVHPVVGAERDDAGRLRAIRHARQMLTRESFEHYQLEMILDPETIEAVEVGVTRVLDDVRATVADFHQMRARIDRMVELTRIGGSAYSQAEVDEGVALLQWLDDDNFVFLGYREYRLTGKGDDLAVEVVPGTGLGILSDESRSTVRKPVPLADLPPDRAARYTEGDLVVVTKTNRRSPVHRAAKMDYVGVRIMGPDGRTAGEARMVGLFTSKAFMQPASETPMLRRKLHDILAAEDLIEGSHDHKAMIELFETFSKHDLFAASTEELRGVLSGLLQLQERGNVRLFIRPDTLHRSVSILVALPQDRFNAALRRELQDMFLEEFKGTSIDYHLALRDADPAQIHFTVWLPRVTDYSLAPLEAKVVALTRSWEEKLVNSLSSQIPPQVARELARRWAGRFPDYYSASTPIDIAATDLVRVDALAASGAPMSVGLQNEAEGGKGGALTRVALYRASGKRPLSELLPALEDLGLTVIEEIPSRISGEGDYFIHDFGVLKPDGAQIDVEGSSGQIIETLEAVWRDGAESDDLNRLVVSTSLGPRDVDILRAYRTYWRRVSPIFTVAYVNDTLAAHPDVAELLVELFAERFDPERDGDRYGELRHRILEGLDRIPSIEEDRILRAFLGLIEATVRTNFYQLDRTALALKLVSKLVPDAPQPHPLFEIFVLGPTVEGIHLRGGMVARGGLRWSTRREDYRTEVLDLMKAQMTKNAVIVPTGAKGGFVLRNPPDDPISLRSEVEAQYRLFIGALLDVTDNRVDGEVVRPARVRAHDADDPYLVVAADKGTATFSDVANSIAVERGFWLGDAFASGGSTGYDHKALGITARGAWRSLERHFAELGIDPSTDQFTAVGIGDMSGDVFGNGLLGSDKIRLIAAFDHRHIFIDPDPDSDASYGERKRLFELPRSSWDDYDRSLISDGGGVYARTEKTIEISDRASDAIGAPSTTFTPNQLIAAILKAPVDLLWNGGIGTYVKASMETHQQVGDRTNDPVRVDGAALRCRVVVEGGNLGLTQRARIEFAEAGGKINTDFIDNSGGVDCSDREVNLKILLDAQVREGALGTEERNGLIAGVADEVVQRILSDNFHQAQAISREVAASPRRTYAYEDLMVSLEEEGILDRDIDAMPSTEAMGDRMKSEVGLTRPEIAVLLANAKRSLSQALVTSKLVADPYLLDDVMRYFPEAIATRFAADIARHPLRAELVATLLAGDIVNSEGVVFVSRLVTQTGAEPVDVVRAYRIARDLTGAHERWARIASIYGEIDHDLWMRLMRNTDRMVASVTRWYLSNGNGGSIGDIVERSRPIIEEMEAGALESGVTGWRDGRISVMAQLIESGVPDDIARRHAVSQILNYGPDVIELSTQSGQTPTDTLHAFLQVGQAFGLDRITEWARSKPIDDRWDRWALWTIEEELLAVRRRAVERAFTDAGGRTGVDAVDAFLASRAPNVARLVRFMRQIDTSGEVDMAQLMVAIRQVRSAIA